MTFPMWFAVPPEVPSAWLSTGMGPGPLLAAARAWHALAAQYTEIATELASVLAAVQASSWQGPSADRFVVAHQPFRYWLTHAATVATAAAAAHETAAAGYTSALGGMPTLAELAANHAMHGALVTTNFFGVNTIPIALNEADYLRMWIQAATVMSHYQAVAHESVAATPSTPPAPQIVTSAASSAASSSFPDPTKLILQLLKDFLELLRYLAVELLPGPLGDLIAQVLDWFISFVSGPVFTFLAYLVLDPLIYFGPFAPLTSPVLLAAGLTGLAGLGAVSGPAGPMVERVHSDGPSRQSWPAATGVTLVGTNPAALVTTPAPAPTTSAAPTAPSTPGSSAAQGLYAVGGPDGEGFNPIAKTTALAGVTTDAAAPAAKLPGDQAQSSASKATRLRRRLRQHRFEFLADDGRLTMPNTPEMADVAAGNRGLDALGFAGTIPKSAPGSATGLTHLGGGFADVLSQPMLPHTWDGSD